MQPVVHHFGWLVVNISTHPSHLDDQNFTLASITGQYIEVD